MDKHKEKKIKTYRTTDKTKKKQEKTRRLKRTIKGLMYSSSTKVSSSLKKSKRSVKLTSSYSPTINQELVTLASLPPENVESCNLEEAYQLNEPLEIYVPDECLQYDSPRAEAELLKSLRANKHVDPAKIVPPIQSHGNCWFNAMFVTFFISDKGRKFFHFFRQLMIKGTQKDKTPMPANLRNAFALLNFGIDNCLKGTEFAYKLDTNSVIFELFRRIPKEYKEKHLDIVDVDDAGNPVMYYLSIMNYLNNNSIRQLFLRINGINWENTIVNAMKDMDKLPHVIIFEIMDEQAGNINKKPTAFKVNKAKYQIDSAVIRDTEKEHFCALITCEGKEMGYDGMSFHRLVPFEWKKHLNNYFTWDFTGSTHADGRPMKWNFMKSYQLLIYYRVT